MKKNILIFGIIAGLIVSIFMAVSMLYCYKSQQYEGNMLLGFSIMILAFSLIFVGIKNYRDHYLHGLISFGKAFQIGILITLIASTFYVVTWAVLYHQFMPDFMDKYANHALAVAKAKGTSAQELKVMSDNFTKTGEAYKNPFVFTAFTYLEIFPIGLLVTLIAAAVLKRKNKADLSSS